MLTNADIRLVRPLTSFLRAWMSSLWVAVVSGGDTSPRPSGILRKAWRVAGLAVIKFLLAGSMLCQAISTLASSFRPIASASSRRVDIKSVKVWPARCCVERKACSLAHLAEALQRLCTWQSSAEMQPVTLAKPLSSPPVIHTARSEPCA